MHMALPHSLGADAQADFRQLRHQTKNALTRILAHVATTMTVNDNARRVAAELERRILLTARISDALFGLTRAPGRFDERLFELCESIVELAGESDQHLTLCCSVEGDVPAADQDTALRVAHELVGNAVKHGMHMRLIGRIDVKAVGGPGGTTVQVIDDGWGCGRSPAHGEGLGVAALLAEARGGRVSLERVGDRTIARLMLPGDAA
jgi:two-component sensor histidine kinase